MKKHFVIKKEPVKPVNGDSAVAHKIYISSEDSIESIINDVKEYCARLKLTVPELSKIKIHSDYYHSLKALFYTYKPQYTKEHFATLMVKYKKRKAEYDKWYKENKADIVAELDRRKKEREKQKEKTKKINELRKEIDKIARS